MLIATAAGLLAATASANAGFILTSSVGALEADAAVNTPLVPALVIDPDPFGVNWDELLADGDASGANSASASAGQAIVGYVGGGTGEGSANTSAISNQSNDASAVAASGYQLEFTVDSPTKILIDWSFFADIAGVGSTFDFVGAILIDGGIDQLLAVDETNPEIEWAQAGQISIDALPGFDYTFIIGVEAETAAGQAAGEFFGASAAQWQFTLRVPSPATLALFAPVGMFATRRRRY